MHIRIDPKVAKEAIAFYKKTGRIPYFINDCWWKEFSDVLDSCGYKTDTTYTVYVNSEKSSTFYGNRTFIRANLISKKDQKLYPCFIISDTNIQIGLNGIERNGLYSI